MQQVITEENMTRVARLHRYDLELVPAFDPVDHIDPESPESVRHFRNMRPEPEYWLLDDDRFDTADEVMTELARITGWEVEQ